MGNRYDGDANHYRAEMGNRCSSNDTTKPWWSELTCALLVLCASPKGLACVWTSSSCVWGHGCLFLFRCVVQQREP